MDVINRNNYESYFLLYADGELSPAEKQEVDAFVLQHPDLAAEFEALKSTRLEPETITFSGKNLLYKTTEQPISVTGENCEEYFILYYDNELTCAERKTVEDFVSAHPEHQENFRLFGDIQVQPNPEEQFSEISGLYRLASGNNYTSLLNYLDGELPAHDAAQFKKELQQNPELNKEFQLFEQTKLSPDTSVRFPGISSLYREEKRSTPVIPLWLRFAAAAAVLVFITWMAFWRNNGQQATPEVVAVKQTPGTNVNTPQRGNNVLQANTANTSLTNVATENSSSTEPVNATLNPRTNNNPGVTSVLPERNNNKQAIQTVPGPELKPAEQPVLVREEQQPANRLPEEFRKIIDKPQTSETIAGVKPDLGNKNITSESNNPADKMFAAALEKEESSSSLSVMNIPADQIAKRSGLKSVGRKITRFFERKIKNNGRPFSIGGVEVAIAR